jgi:hypothetical protein
MVLSFALACAARFPGLGSFELSLDETWTWYVTEEILRTGEFWRTLTHGVDAPLFGAINVLLAKAAGVSAFALRVPPALFGAASVPLIFVLLRRRHTERLALLASLLAAWNPFLLFYSKDARPYAQLLFFSLLFTYAFQATRGSRPLLRRLVTSICAVLAVTSHYYALVYFAAFYAVTLLGHRLARSRADLRADFLTGCFNLVAVAPFLIPLLFGLGSVSVPYWQSSDISLPGILVEQFLFLGTTLPHGGVPATLLNLIVFTLLLVPLLDAIRHDPGSIRNELAISSLWWVSPAIVAGVSILIGQDLLFYPRGFISTVPFLLAYWVLFTGNMSISKWLKVPYVALLLGPFLLSGYSVATNHPGQAYLGGRDRLAQIVRDLDSHQEEFDIILIHHWWMAPYFAYHYPERSKVWALGSEGPGEKGLIADLERVPPRARVLLVLNDIATERTDPKGVALQFLSSRRALIRELPCSQESLLGLGLLCNRILLFGPDSSFHDEPS